MAVPVIVKLGASAALMYPSVATVPIPTTGAVRSTVTVPVSTEVSVLPVFPAASTKLAQETPRVPSVSSPLRVSRDVQDVPEPPIVVVSPSIVQTRLVTVSDAVIVSVTSSPLLARVVTSLSDAIDMVRVGRSVSTT